MKTSAAIHAGSAAELPFLMEDLDFPTRRGGPRALGGGADDGGLGDVPSQLAAFLAAADLLARVVLGIGGLGVLSMHATLARSVRCHRDRTERHECQPSLGAELGSSPNGPLGGVRAVA